MPFRRVLTSLGIAGLLIAVSFPTVAAAQQMPASERSAPADSAPTPVAVHDPAQDAAPRIHLTGVIRTTVFEPKPRPAGASLAVDSATTTFTVTTSSGTTVSISGPIPASVKSGARFSGTVAVPKRLIAHLDTGSAQRLSGSAAGSALKEGDAAAMRAVTVAADSTVALPVARAQITPQASPPATPKNHVLDIVEPILVGTTQLDAGLYTDAKVQDIARNAGGYWAGAASRNPGNNLIPQVNVSTVTHYSSIYKCATPIDQVWDEAAIKLGYTGAQNYLDLASGTVVHHLVVLLPPQCQENNETGIGTIGSSLNSGGLVEDTLGLTVDTVTLAHEIGHNLSLGHANVDYCGPDSVAVGCAQFEYGDVYDVMGASIENYDVLPVPSSRTMVTLGFQNPAATKTLALADPHVAQTFSVRLFDQLYTGDSTTLTAVVITDPITQDTYYLDAKMAWSGVNEPFYMSGPVIGLDGTASYPMLAAPGARLLRSTSDNGQAIVTQPDLNYTYNDAAIESGRTDQNDTVQNPSGSVRVKMDDDQGGAGMFLTVTLTPLPTDVPAPVYRFWSPTLQVHFYTISAQEKQVIQQTYPASVWTYEGIGFSGFTTQVAGTVPLFRFWSPRLGDHFYTTNPAERDYIIGHYDTNTWRYEGVAYYVYPLDTTVPNTETIARFWSPRLQNHFYTANPIERDEVIRDYPDTTWTFEDNEFRVPAG